MKKIITLSIAAIMAFGLMSFDILYSTGEPDCTGSPADGGATCLTCHTGNAINTGGGSITITSSPSLASGYTAGDSYTISVTVTKSGQSQFGFDFEALKINNSEAGSLTVLNSLTQIMPGASVNNMVHTDASSTTANSTTFTFKWTAPVASTGTVTFYASGNASDGDGSTSGDFIYKTSLAVNEAVSGSAITINSGSYNLNVGTVQTQNKDTLPVAAITPGASGAGQTWDFTALVTRETGTNTIIDPSTGVLFNKYISPVPNACMKQGSSDYLYFDKSTSKIDLLGYAGDLLQNSTNNALVMSNPGTVITFPSTYNTTFNDVSAYDAKYAFNGTYSGIQVDSVREKETINTTSLIDGWGTVKTPTSGAAGYPCLRQKVTDVSVDSTWAKIVNPISGLHYWINTSGTTSTSISYSYISDMILGGVVVDIQMKTGATGILNTDISEVKWNPAVALAANITASTNVNCFGYNTGSATVTATGGTGPYSYSWNTVPVKTTASVTGLAAGSYTVTVTDANNFVTTATITITGPTAALSATTSATDDNGSANGTATVTPSGGTSPYTYSWSTAPVQTNATATGIATGQYSVVVTDNKGCTYTTGVFVNSTLAGTAVNITSGTYYNTINLSTSITLKIDTLPVAAITPGSSGVNVNWDFTALVVRKATTNAFINPSTGVLFGSYLSPVPNACIKQDNANYIYFDTSSTKVELLGYAGDLLQNTTNNALVLNNAETVITFPSTYGTGFNDVTAYDSKLAYNGTYSGIQVDSVREKETVSINSLMDAFGTVVTPTSGAQGYPCLRQKITKVSVDSTWAKIVNPISGLHYWMNTSGTTSTTISYSYISDMILGGAVVDIQMKTNATGSANTDISEVKWNPAVSTVGITNYNSNSEIAIYPNPASNVISIMNTANESLNAIIYDLTGREVLNSGSISGQNNNISVLNISNGTYILKVYNEKGLVQSNKIIVMH